MRVDQARVAILAILLVSSGLLGSATPVAAQSQIGPTRKSGFQNCPVGSQVIIDSMAAGKVTHGWTTGGGPNPYYQTAVFWQAGTVYRSTDTGARSVTWFISATSYNGSSYGIESGGAFCS